MLAEAVQLERIRKSGLPAFEQARRRTLQTLLEQYYAHSSS